MKKISLPLKPSYLPLLVGIAITDRCNLNCKMCERNFYLKKGILDVENDLSLTSLKIILKKIKEKVKFVNISAGYGEPLLHKEIIKIVQEIKNNNLKVILFTNATLLSEEISQGLIDAKLDIILFSFEGYSQEEYENLRRGADYRKVFENIKYFSLLKKRKKSATKTIITATITKENYFQKIDSLIKKAKNLGVERLEIHDTFFYKISKNGQQTIFDEKNKSKLIQKFHILKKMARKKGIELVLPKILKKKRKIVCPDAWRSLYFRKDGYLRPCCVDYEMVWNKNIFQEDLEEIWNCEEMIDWRRKFIEKRPPKMCKKCPIAQIEDVKDIKNIF